MEQIAGLANDPAQAGRRRKFPDLFFLGNGGQTHDLPVCLLQHVPGKIVLMQALHCDDDGAARLVVQTGVQGAVVPLIDRAAARVRQRFVRLERVVDDDEIGAAARQNAADRARKPKAVGTGREFLNRLFAPGKRGLGEQLAIERSAHYGAAFPRQFIGEVLRIARADDLSAWVMPQRPGRQRDRGADRLEMPRRDEDQESARVFAEGLVILRLVMGANMDRLLEAVGGAFL